VTNLLQLDLNVNTCRQVQLHQRIHGLVGRVDDVHQTLVRADFELVAAGLVDVRGAQNIEALEAGRQGHGAFDDGAGAFRGINDFQCGLIDEFVIERFKANPDFLLLHDRLSKNEGATEGTERKKAERDRSARMTHGC
jgi:hypothetical protein